MNETFFYTEYQNMISAYTQLLQPSPTLRSLIWVYKTAWIWDATEVWKKHNCRAM